MILQILTPHEKYNVSTSKLLIQTHLGLPPHSRIKTSFLGGGLDEAHQAFQQGQLIFNFQFPVENTTLKSIRHAPRD